MTYYITNWKGERRPIQLNEALTPDEGGGGGIAENAMAQARTNARVIGKLLAELVERHVLPLDDACRIAEVLSVEEE